MKGTIFLAVVILFCCTIRAQTDALLGARQMALNYKTGVVSVANGKVQLTIPSGFKFLNAEQSKYIISELWHQSPKPDLAGILFPERCEPLVNDSYAFVINYEPRGFVKDEDANKIDYKQVLQNLQREEAEENVDRQVMGYAKEHLVGWVKQPQYDKSNRVLYWAKELQVNNKSEHVVSYNIRVLGRNGILTMNAESPLHNAALLKNDINNVMHIASFTEGNRYADFNAKTDKVAAWTIGTLVTGKILSKTSRIFSILGRYLNLFISCLAIVVILIWNILYPAAYCCKQFTGDMGLVPEEVSV